MRVHYRATTDVFTAVMERAIDMTDAAHAWLVERYAIGTPVWHARAELALYDGLPGGAEPPVEVTRGELVLDGSTVVLGGGPRVMSAHLRRVYIGALASPGVDPANALWHGDSTSDVWV